MSVHVAAPAALLALLAVPLFLLTARHALAAAVCRALAASAVVLALAGLTQVRARPARGACVVAAIDVSASVGLAAVESARRFLGDLVPALGEEDVLGTIAFATHPRLLAAPAAGRPVLAALLPAGEPDDAEASTTDLAAALATGAALCPEGKQAALVLFTDGNETAGSLLAEATLMEPRVPVFPVVPPLSALPPVTIRRLLAPALAPAHTIVPVEAVIETRAAVTAAVELALDGHALPPRPVELGPGTAVVPLPYRASGPGHHLLAARLLLAPARRLGPAVRAALTVTRPVRVLVVSERGTAPVTAVALERRGMEVTVVPPAALATRAGRLDDTHVVVLDDVGSARLSGRALEALHAHVARGGGLVVTGGEHLFGDPGFVGTPLERVLPVALQAQEPEPEAREPIALYLLIDRSNSMSDASLGVTRMDYAKRAALAVLAQLDGRDLVGAIAFDSEPYELGSLRSVANSRAALAERIRRLRSGGGTDFKDALEIAARHLTAAGPSVRHVILLTDGDTNRHTEDHLALIDELAHADITVTALRIGADTINLDLLTRIARTTGGEFHHVESMDALPQLMIRDLQRQRDAATGRRAVRPRLGQPGPMLAGIDEAALPPVARWAVTRARPDAEIRLSVEADGRRDPLLVTWQYELGRVAVLPLDFQGDAASWATWRDFSKLWAQLVRWAAPRGLASERHLQARRRSEGVEVSVETVADERGPFVLRLRAGGELALRPTGRRHFVAIAPDLAPGIHRGVLVAGSAATEEPVELVVPAGIDSAEGRATGPALPLLQQVAALTGGRVGPAAREVLAARPGVEWETRPLAGILIPLAIVLVLADVALRRLRPVSPAARRGSSTPSGRAPA